MPATYENGSAPERMLYSHQKALEAALELGAVPERLFRVLYPVWRVQVEGWRRVAADFDELEWFIERGLREAGLASIQELSAFFGLEERFVRHLVSSLTSIGHITGSETRLMLTALGDRSVQDKLRYQDQQVSAQALFDGLGSRPLTGEHYHIPIFDVLPETGRFQAFYLFGRQWDEKSLPLLLARPDRAQLNLPDEVKSHRCLGEEPAYLPVYIVQRRSGGAAGLLAYLVFSRVRGLRDAVLEEAVNEDGEMRAALQAGQRDDLGLAVQSLMEQYGLKEEEWYLKQAGARGAEVRIDGEVLRRRQDSARSFSPDQEIGAPGGRGPGMGGRMSTREIGKYLLARDWCVWITCDDAALRRQAAAEQLLDWLQYSTARITEEDIRGRVEQLSIQLETDPVPVEELYRLAGQQRLARAAERLEPIN